MLSSMLMITRKAMKATAPEAPSYMVTSTKPPPSEGKSFFSWSWLCESLLIMICFWYDKYRKEMRKL